VFDAPDWLTSLQAQYRMRRLEHDFVGAASASVRAFAREAPSDPERFSAWFARLEQLSSHTTDALFTRLAHEASAAQLRWFVGQYSFAQAGFRELSAVVQRKLTPGARVQADVEAGAFASDPLACLGQTLASASSEDTVWEALAVSNLMVALAANRRYAYHAAGALAAAELTASRERAPIECGFARLGLYDLALESPNAGRGWTWLRDGIPALVAQDPGTASQIAEGALSRLAATARCFERCHRELDQICESFGAACPQRMLSGGASPDVDAAYAN
jgi:hypothetical protein